jgi:Zn-dependent protease
MNWNLVFDGLIGYLCLLILLTFHEAAHAWTAWKCGDDTAYQEGRVSLNPVVHMDMLGTVILPLAVVLLGAAGSGMGRFIIGWGKPVPVYLGNLRKPRLQDTLIAVAGPAMNLILAVALMFLARVFVSAEMSQMAYVVVRMSQISLLLCFFNLLPIPPLDGSHVLKNFIGMSDETYIRISQFGFIIVIVLIQLQLVSAIINYSTRLTFMMIERLVGLPLVGMA